MKIYMKGLIVAAVIVVFWLLLRFVVGVSEDTWICDNGQWVKHGEPAAAKPTEPCQ